MYVHKNKVNPNRIQINGKKLQDLEQNRFATVNEICLIKL